MGMQQTKDLLNFSGDIAAAIAQTPELVAAFKSKDPKAIGAGLMAMATGPAGHGLIASGSQAFDGIGEVVTEFKSMGVLDGVDLARNAIHNVEKVYVAYNDSRLKDVTK